jgi:hypothetical protein
VTVVENAVVRDDQCRAGEPANQLSARQAGMSGGRRLVQSSAGAHSVTLASARRASAAAEGGNWCKGQPRKAGVQI